MARTREELRRDRDHLLKIVPAEWTSTSEIAETLRTSPATARTDCSWLEEKGWIESRRVHGEKRVFFCPECDAVVTSENYAECRLKGIRPFYPWVRQWRRTRAGSRELSRRGDSQ
jgi:predicted transcriptional regulator of viral defense system